MRIAILISGEGTNLQAVIDAVKAGELDAKIVVVISNRERANGLNRAKEADIPIGYFPYTKSYLTREDYDSKLADGVAKFKPDIVLLAGWMHVLTAAFLSKFPAVINLHPALPGEFPGADGIGDAWKAFKAGKTKRTGVMVHYVDEGVDTGKVIDTVEVPIYHGDTLEQLRTRVRTAEKPLLIRALKRVINGKHTIMDTQTDLSPKKIENREVRFNSAHMIRKGKVRNIYDIGYNMLALEHTDRQSALDRHVCDIESRGVLLAQLSDWWFRQTRQIVPNHLLYTSGNVMIVKRCEPIPLEIIVRGYITGSLWQEYEKGERIYCGAQIPNDLSNNQRLPQPIVTPTTKGDIDLPITPDEIIAKGMLSQDQWDYISATAIKLFKYGQFVAESAGMILVDTKYEFGIYHDSSIVLIDEIHTPDSSRFWNAETYADKYEKGEPQDNFDKDAIRQYIKKAYPRLLEVASVDVPEDIIDKTRNAYIACYERLTNRPLDSSRDVKLVVEEYIFYHHPTAFIIMGSRSDEGHVDKIVDELNKHGVPSIKRILSAHKDPRALLDFLESVTNPNGVFITVAGLSNALGGVVAHTSSLPTINCPPIDNGTSLQMDIWSSLRCPSDVAVATILNPKNCAQHVAKILRK